MKYAHVVTDFCFNKTKKAILLFVCIKIHLSSARLLFRPADKEHLKPFKRAETLQKGLFIPLFVNLFKLCGCSFAM